MTDALTHNAFVMYHLSTAFKGQKQNIDFSSNAGSLVYSSDQHKIPLLLLTDCSP
jgi:hypothetical protein